MGSTCCEESEWILKLDGNEYKAMIRYLKCDGAVPFTCLCTLQCAELPELKWNEAHQYLPTKRGCLVRDRCVYFFWTYRRYAMIRVLWRISRHITILFPLGVPMAAPNLPKDYQEGSSQMRESSSQEVRAHT